MFLVFFFISAKPDNIQVANYVEMKDSINGIDPVSERKKNLRKKTKD